MNFTSPKSIIDVANVKPNIDQIYQNLEEEKKTIQIYTYIEKNYIEKKTNMKGILYTSIHKIDTLIILSNKICHFEKTTLPIF